MNIIILNLTKNYQNKFLHTTSLGFLFVTILLCVESYAQQGKFKIRDDGFIQLAYNQPGSLTIGGVNSTPNNGQWAIEHFNNGLNFWRAWPAPYAGNYKLFIRDYNGYVGIGKFPYYKLDVQGNIRAWNGFWTVSDEKLKTNIKELDGVECLSILHQIKSYSYSYRLDELNQEDLTKYENDIKKKTADSANSTLPSKGSLSEMQRGFLAQEIQKVIPDIVNESGDGYLSINYIALIPIMLEAMKEQQKEKEELSNQVKILEQKLSEVVMKLDELSKK